MQYQFNMLGFFVDEDGPDGLKLTCFTCKMSLRFSQLASPIVIESDLKNHDLRGCSPHRTTHISNLVTPKQMVAMRAIAHTKRINLEEFSLKELRCVPEQLNRNGASILIDRLKALSFPRAVA